jgi:hypothetical protein
MVAPPLASMASRGEKLGGDPWISQSTCCGSGRKPFFSGAVTLLNFVDDYAKGCYTRIARDMYCRVSYVD